MKKTINTNFAHETATFNILALLFINFILSFVPTPEENNTIGN
jgi:hypothetical protein